MNTLAVVAGPVIGSLIGYITNYIAVRMLFRPLRPVKIGNWTLPFTPGIFPKRKEKLAKALGKAVGNNLLRREDLEQLFLTENIKEKVVEAIDNSLFTEDDHHTIKRMVAPYFQEDSYQSGKKQLENIICEKIISGLSKIDIGSIIVQESSRAIKEKTQGTMLAMMVNDKLITALATPVGGKVEEYIKASAPDNIRSIVQEEMERLENQTIGNLVRQMGLDKESVRAMTKKIYGQLIQDKVGELTKQFDIAGVVEQKVNAMDVLEIENLVLSVMKNELRAIVNLGALIGFILGLLNIFV